MTPRPTSTRATRRAVLRGGTGAAVAAVAAAATGLVPMLGSCSRTPPTPDELEDPLAAARADAALAAAAATRYPALAARLGPVADDRRAHAAALAAEVERARPDRTDAVDADAGDDPDAPAPPPPAVPPTPDAALAAVRDGLGRARTEGATLALRVSAYRCGLLASVSASCAAHVVDLA